jgi:formate hydrogenlyase subunit 6/NADH:ubiquinone oxidoreductase subunit I
MPGAILIDEALCVGCSYCKLACPSGAIAVQDATARVTEVCTACEQCLGVCPVDAISVAAGDEPDSARQEET